MLKINGEEWRILLTSPNHPMLERSDGRFTIGVCDDPTKTIYISEDTPPSLMKNVLAHEITHAAMFSYNIEMNLDQEELLANLVATYGQEIVCKTNLIFHRLTQTGELC